MKDKKERPLSAGSVGAALKDIVQRSGQAIQAQGDVIRRQIDAPYRRNTGKNSYKNRQFGGTRTATDEYTGKTVYYSANGAGKGRSDPRHYTTARTSNVDHITPIDVLIDRYGHLVPKEDLRLIANSDHNLAITNEALNKSKGGMTNLQYLLTQLENGAPEDAATALRMLAAQLRSKAGITVDISRLLLHDAHQVGSQAAQGAALVGGAVSLVQNICGVCSVEISVEDAMENVAVSTAETTLTAYTIGSTGALLILISNKKYTIRGRYGKIKVVMKDAV